MLESSVLLFAAGNFLWDLSVHYDSSVGFRFITFLTLGLALLYSIFSYSTTPALKRKLLKSDLKPSPTSYTYLFSHKSRNTKTYFN